jgi:hypothetical protein
MPFIIDLRNIGGQTPVTNGPRSWDRPFDDLTAELTFDENYIQTVADFVPTALDTPHDSYPDCYLVSEGPRDNVGGFYKWTRTYARIPPSRQVFESYSWLVPGIGTGAVFSPQTVSSAVDAAGTTTLTCAGDTTAVAGDSLSISYTFTDSVTGTQYGRTVIRTMTGGSGTAPSVALISEPGGTITYNTAKKVEPGRPAEALEVGSSLQLDYYLPGVSAGIGTPFDIPIIDELQIYNGDGIKVDSFAADTSPTIATWRLQVAASDKVCVVASIVRRWKGNIYERATRYCIAR